MLSIHVLVRVTSAGARHSAMVLPLGSACSPARILLVAVLCVRGHALSSYVAEPSSLNPGHPSRSFILREALLDFRQNNANHRHELAESASLGYQPIRQLPPPPWEPPAVQSFHVPLAATGMGPVCPFAFAADAACASLSLVFETTAPLLSDSECEAIILSLIHI